MIVRQGGHDDASAKTPELLHAVPQNSQTGAGRSRRGRRHGSLSPARAALLEHRAGLLSFARLLRELVDHEDWHVAANPDSDEPLRLGVGSDVALVAFSDRAAVEAAAERLDDGVAPHVVDGVPGTRLFGPLGEGCSRVDLDTGSVHALAFGADEFGLLRLQARAIGVEKALRHPDQTALLCVSLGRYDGFRVVMQKADVQADWTIVRSHGRNGEPAALVFTAPDCVEAWRDTVLRDPSVELATVQLGGDELFARLPGFGLPHMLFNPCGPPSPAAFKTSLCHVITSMG